QDQQRREGGRGGEGEHGQGEGRLVRRDRRLRRRGPGQGPERRRVPREGEEEVVREKVDGRRAGESPPARFTFYRTRSVYSGCPRAFVPRVNRNDLPNTADFIHPETFLISPNPFGPRFRIWNFSLSPRASTSQYSATPASQ